MLSSAVVLTIMVILSHSDTRALCLGMAQLIPVFLVVLFVLDSLWIRQSFERQKREIIELERETQEILAERTQLDRRVPRTILILGSLDIALRLMKTIAVGAQLREITKAQAELNDKRASLRKSRGAPKKDVQRYEESQDPNRSST